LLYLLAHLKQRRLVRRWFLAQAVALVPLIPWLVWYVARAIRPAGLGWIPRPSLLAPVYTLWNFTTADVTTITPLTVSLAIGIGLVFAAGLIRCGKVRRLLVLWLGFPIGFLFLLSLKRPYYVDRYVMASLPAYLLLLALGIVAWRNCVPRLLATAGVVVSMLWSTIRIVGDDPYFAKEDWRGGAAAIDAQLEPGDMIVFQDDETSIGMSVYRTKEWPYLILGASEASKLLQEALSQNRRVWLVWRSPHESNHRLSKSAPFDVFEEATFPVRGWLGTHRDQVALDLRLPGLCLVRVDAD
jgi:mannosyltransferase